MGRGTMIFGLRKEVSMERLWKRLVLFIEKSVFYLGVAGRKTLAFLLASMLALFYLGGGFWLYLVVGPTLYGNVVIMSDHTINGDYIYYSAAVYSVIPLFMIEAARLVMYATNLMCTWTAEDYFNKESGARKAVRR